MGKKKGKGGRRGGGAMTLSRKNLATNLGAAAVGAVAAQAVPGLGTQISPTVPINYGAIAGVFIVLKARNPMLRWAGFGMILGGGLVQWAESLIGPQLSDLGARE